MTEKLISAIDVLKYTVLAGEIRNQYMEVVPAYFVREAPAVEAEPVRHGEWLPIYQTLYNKHGASQIATEWSCSQCGCLLTDRRNYCPNCGAKMDGDSE